MVPPLRRLLFGPADARFQRTLDLLLATALLVATFVAYALGVLDVAGCVVFLPGQAALVGVLGAGLVGYRRSGLILAWVVAYAPLLGYRADHAFLGLSGRPFTDQFAYFVGLDGLAVLAVVGIVLGTLAFAVGHLVSLGIEFLRSDATPDPSE